MSEPPLERPERRSGTRLLALRPGWIETLDGTRRIAFVRDLSETGALLFVRSSRFQADDEVRLSVDLSDGAEGVVVTGRVVRIEPTGPHSEGPWSQRIAVAFDRPCPLDSEEVAFLVSHVKRFGQIVA